ncbi:type III flagellar switch regulator (C-ring) FliN [Buttiauxella sp. JUb87]|jgi:flagellar motor switch/type III secretory pathway protein FliN|uniref:FliM/FliN family flagellar motor switch protein n=1 Tax=unclassified Buttiauxella TaxID=2634062 RepID=UPI001061AE74|nr:MULTISPECIES: FliM/FliN family flagellar motor switch protein [unclassified Buttiauxella]TDN49796.1 type III flagellar switch regulator (C-ring) FliN [Buttiauxella sp. JUb87]
MVNQKKSYKSRVIAPEQGKLYPTMELGQEQEIRLLQVYVDSAMERISIMLGQFLRSVGCIRVEPLELEFRELSPVEQKQWIWCAALAPLGGRASKMFRFGMHRATSAFLTESALGLKPANPADTNNDQPPSETELRFLNLLGNTLTQGVIAENPYLQELSWQQQPSDSPERKGLCMTMQLVFHEHTWPLTLHWHTEFAELLDKGSDQTPVAPPITRHQLEESLRKIPVQLKTTLFSRKLTILELEQLLQGELLPIVLQERVTLGCGGFSMGVGRIYDRNGHLAFQLHDVSQQTS